MRVMNDHHEHVVKNLNDVRCPRLPFVVSFAVRGVVARTATEATGHGFVTLPHLTFAGPMGVIALPALATTSTTVSIARRAVEHVATPSDDVPGPSPIDVVHGRFTHRGEVLVQRRIVVPLQRFSGELLAHNRGMPLKVVLHAREQST